MRGLYDIHSKGGAMSDDSTIGESALHGVLRLLPASKLLREPLKDQYSLQGQA